jgi:hypothetical protein
MHPLGPNKNSKFSGLSSIDDRCTFASAQDIWRLPVSLVKRSDALTTNK